MKQKPPLAERLLDRLVKLGMTQRKAKEVAKGLAPTAARQKVSGTVTGKLEAKLIKLGLSERKAKEMAKGLAPLVRSTIKARVKKAKVAIADVDDQMVEESVAQVTDEAEDPELDKVAPRVNGHRVRLDLATVGVHGQKGIELLRVMHGLSTSNTYLVAAVKSDEGIVAVRQFGSNEYKIKFYPTMAYWGKTREELASLGATSYLDRRSQNLYERMMVNRESLDQILGRLAAEAKPKSRMRALLDRFMTVTAAPLIKAFDYLHKRIGVAA
jgi:hypothetical protein